MHSSAVSRFLLLQLIVFFCRYSRPPVQPYNVGLISPVGSFLCLIFFPQQLFQSRSLFISASGILSTRVNCILFCIKLLLMYMYSSSGFDIEGETETKT